MNVLLVDDQLEVRKSMGRLLCLAGCTVTEARNGAEALVVLRDKTQHIDFIILDLSMPEMCGLTFLEKGIEDNLINQPVAVVTGMDSEWAIGVAGIDFVFEKPMTEDKMEMLLINMNLAITRAKQGSRRNQQTGCNYVGRCPYQEELPLAKRS